MLLKSLCALGAFAARASAFKDTSPYLLFSTSESLIPTSNSQLRLASDVFNITREFLSSCPSELYIVVSQPNAIAADYSNPKAVPRLRKALSNKNVKTQVSVSELIGELKAEEIQKHISSQCDAAVENYVTSAAPFTTRERLSKPLVVRIDFPPLPASNPKRASELVDNDALMYSILENLPTSKYTIIYTTTPSTDTSLHYNPSYEPVFVEQFHMGIKRQSNFNVAVPNSNVPRKAPLFERYQFFTPGLFMALLVTFILVSILSVGIAALGSLQVSYGAFDREMGPSSQKKQQ